jgi:hypothetical protein
MAKMPVIPSTKQAPSHSDTHPDKDEKKAIEEREEQTISKPGGFRNDPDDPKNPNEAIAKHRRTLARKASELETARKSAR